jgi:hypothetical protein
VREWLVYKLYNLVTPKSFRARLVKVELDMAKRKKPAAFYGILLEEEKQMAKRNKMVTINRRMNPGTIRRSSLFENGSFRIPYWQY